MEEHRIQLFDHKSFLMGLFVYWFMGNPLTIPIVIVMMLLTIAFMFVEYWLFPENFRNDGL